MLKYRYHAEGHALSGVIRSGNRATAYFGSDAALSMPPGGGKMCCVHPRGNSQAAEFAYSIGDSPYDTVRFGYGSVSANGQDDATKVDEDGYPLPTYDLACEIRELEIMGVLSASHILMQFRMKPPTPNRSRFVPHFELLSASDSKPPIEITILGARAHLIMDYRFYNDHSTNESLRKAFGIPGNSRLTDEEKQEQERVSKHILWSHLDDEEIADYRKNGLPSCFPITWAKEVKFLDPRPDRVTQNNDRCGVWVRVEGFGTFHFGEGADETNHRQVTLIRTELGKEPDDQPMQGCNVSRDGSTPGATILACDVTENTKTGTC